MFVDRAAWIWGCPQFGVRPNGELVYKRRLATWTAAMGPVR